VNDGKLILLMVGMHLLALAAAAALVYLAVHEANPPLDPPPDDGPSQDGGSAIPRPRPRGGPPLLDATPARIRLRGPARLGDSHRRRRGRQRHQRPARTRRV
jgi:hypothetical protein